MSENTSPPEEPARRGRPPAKRTRRNFTAELTDLQSRVDLAIRLLRKAPGDIKIVDIAIETLEGKE